MAAEKNLLCLLCTDEEVIHPSSKSMHVHLHRRHPGKAFAEGTTWRYTAKAVPAETLARAASNKAYRLRRMQEDAAETNPELATQIAQYEGGSEQHYQCLVCEDKPILPNVRSCTRHLNMKHATMMPEMGLHFAPSSEPVTPAYLSKYLAGKSGKRSYAMRKVLPLVRLTDDVVRFEAQVEVAPQDNAVVQFAKTLTIKGMIEIDMKKAVAGGLVRVMEIE